ncbi:LysM peptidoglycan-binding domain-containing protein [Vannielia sp.]|uniref:LysM peptidoglycan-binding domain-containing protein n=1 Tax=Vannielia sp. TaxID=2813045 RepID=UPI002626B0FA|nr:LysM peptidoglycan-binding domain-containing protein [Vannielia sp.]MDF1872887.1 LysM peptidoglycan-binding domain-containing protein [Vannielia sp.]
MSAENGKPGAVAGAAVALVLAALGVVGWVWLSPPEKPGKPEAVTGAESPGTTTPAAEATAAPPEADPTLPSLDTLRVERDGSTVLGGHSAPGDQVVLLLDGQPLVETSAEADGNFAALTTIPPGEDRRLLTMVARGPEGERRSEQVVIVEPIRPSEPQGGGAPDATAEATPPAETTARPAPSITPDTGSTADTESTATGSTATGPAGAANSLRPKLLVATKDSLRVLQPDENADTSAPLRVETIGYAEGGVRLSGRGIGPAENLRIYLDNAPIATAPLADDGTWDAQLEGVAPGTYQLRVDQIGAGGKVTRRFETAFLRESEESLARQAASQTDAEGLSVSVITVQPGYTLWAIASDRYGDGLAYHKVLEANAGLIRDPDLIYPGQVFDLPE